MPTRREAFDELELDEAEGGAEAFSDEMDEWDEGDEMDELDELEGEGADELDELDEGDSIDDFEAADEGDEFDELDEGDELGEEDEGADAWETGLAYAMAAEDSDEFLRRIRRAARRVAAGVRRAGSVVGRVARVAAPILSAIPHPAAQAAARVARVASRLRYEGASEEEALEAAAELAVRMRGALPVVAGTAARLLVRHVAPNMPAAQRRRIVRQLLRLVTDLVRRRGRTAVRAVPRIVRSVRRSAAVRRTPAAARPRVAANAARRVAAMPRLARRLSAPLPRGQAAVRRAAPNVRIAGGAMRR